MRNLKKCMRIFVAYIKRTWKIKLGAIGLLTIGLMTLLIDTDATFFVFALMISTGLFLHNGRFPEEEES